MDFTHKVKKQLAANNLKSRVVTIDTINATTTTVSAINKASELYNNSPSQNLHTNLRIMNLEKSLHHQEQKTSEDKELLPSNGKEKNINHQKQPQKHPKRSRANNPSQNTSPPKKSKGIQWKEAEIQQYFPHQPSSTLITTPFRENLSTQQ